MVLGTDNPYPRSIGSFQVPVLPPEVDPDASPLTTVCFSSDWLPLVIGALQQLTLQATWQGDAADVQLASDRAQLLISMFGAADGGCQTGLCIPDVFYDPDCDCIKWLPPGSVDPVENPALDPRHADSLRYPPNAAADQRCQAAANMTRFISDLIAEVILVVDSAGTAEGLIAILLPFLVELGPFGILIDLVLGLAFVLFSAGATAIAAAFTSTVYDQLTCIFFCNVAEDGSVDSAALAAIQADIAAQIGGLVQTVLDAMFFLMGEVGLSNAGAVGDAPADCDDCACSWCWSMTPATNLEAALTPYLFSGIGSLPSWTGTSWQSYQFTTPPFGHDVVWMGLRIEFDPPVRLTYIDLNITALTDLNIYYDGAPDYTDPGTFMGNGHWEGDQVVDSINFQWVQVDAAYTIELFAATWQGLGDNPFGESNC